MKNKYLIAVDLDDTLIYDFDQSDQVSFDFLKKLSKTNYIIIATGRPFRSSKDYYEMLDLKTPIINYNGALVHNPNDSNFPTTRITINKEIIFSLLKEYDYLIQNIFCEDNDDIYLAKQTNEIIPFLHKEGGNLIVGDLEKTLNVNPNGALMIAKAGSEKKLEKVLKEKYNNKIKLRFWEIKGTIILEVYSPKTSKGNALKQISEYYNIPRDKTIAIGDSHNDLEMIEFANYSVAMANSQPALLKAAKYKTDRVQNNGVYKYLSEFFK